MGADLGRVVAGRKLCRPSKVVLDLLDRRPESFTKEGLRGRPSVATLRKLGSLSVRARAAAARVDRAVAASDNSRFFLRPTASCPHGGYLVADGSAPRKHGPNKHPASADDYWQ